MLPFLRDLAAHSEWANAVFFHAWGKSPARDHEEMRRRVAHVLGVQQGFLSVLRGEPPGSPPQDGRPPRLLSRMAPIFTDGPYRLEAGCRVEANYPAANAAGSPGYFASRFTNWSAAEFMQ